MVVGGEEVKLGIRRVRRVDLNPDPSFYRISLASFSMDASTKQFISDGAIKLMGMSESAMVEYVAAIGELDLILLLPFLPSFLRV